MKEQSIQEPWGDPRGERTIAGPTAMFARASAKRLRPRRSTGRFSTAAPRKLTAAQKALSAAKAKGTRAVRGATGKVQRQQVTVEGSPGLSLVAADGTPIPGATQGPIAPAATVKTAAAAATPTAPTAGK